MRSNIFIVAVIAFFTSQVQGTQYKVTDQVYFDIQQNNRDLGRIVIGLFGEIAPKTVKNFVTVAKDGIDGKNFTGSIFHRVISRFMIQGGDITGHDGKGSISIYGEYFDDENFDVKHKGPGFISMANAGKNTNGCQFFITTIPTPWLDGHHTVFGKVVDGQEVIHKIEQVKTDTDDRPLEPVIIKDSGVLETKEPFFISDELYDVWGWINASLLPLGMSFSILGIFHWFICKLNI